MYWNSVTELILYTCKGTIYGISNHRYIEKESHYTEIESRFDVWWKSFLFHQSDKDPDVFNARGIRVSFNRHDGQSWAFIDVKLCLDIQLQDREIVSRTLKSIFERTFDRVVLDWPIVFQQ